MQRAHKTAGVPHRSFYKVAIDFVGMLLQKMMFGDVSIHNKHSFEPVDVVFLMGDVRATSLGLAIMIEWNVQEDGLFHLQHP